MSTSGPDPVERDSRGILDPWLLRQRLHLTRYPAGPALDTLVDRFWAPVGQGAKPEQDTNYVIETLFRGPSGLEFFDRTVASRIARLPGFAGFTALSEKVAPIVQT